MRRSIFGRRQHPASAAGSLAGCAPVLDRPLKDAARLLIRRLPVFHWRLLWSCLSEVPKAARFAGSSASWCFHRAAAAAYSPDAAIDLQQAEGATYGAEAIQHLDQVGAARKLSVRCG